MLEPEKEIDRLRRIIEAYEKLTSFSRNELLEANQAIRAHETVNELSRHEIATLHERIRQLQDGEESLQERIKLALAEDGPNESAIVETLEHLRRNSNENFYVDLFHVLVHYDFSPEEQQKAFEWISQHLDSKGVFVLDILSQTNIPVLGREGDFHLLKGPSVVSSTMRDYIEKKIILTLDMDIDCDPEKGIHPR